MNQQCLGITKAGTRCKIKNNLVNGYCRLHRNQDTQSNPESQTGLSPEHTISPDEKKQDRVLEESRLHETEENSLKKTADAHASDIEDRSKTYDKTEDDIENRNQSAVPPVEQIRKHPGVETPVGERIAKDSATQKKPDSVKTGAVKLLISCILISLTALLAALTRKR